jgi:hypothetical protein
MQPNFELNGRIAAYPRKINRSVKICSGGTGWTSTMNRPSAQGTRFPESRDDSSDGAMKTARTRALAAKGILTKLRYFQWLTSIAHRTPTAAIYKAPSTLAFLACSEPSSRLARGSEGRI